MKCNQMTQQVTLVLKIIHIYHSIHAIQHLCTIKEELRLQQRKRQLGLQINFTEAEEKAYAEPAKSEMFQTLDETGPDQDRVDSINHSLLIKKKLDYYVIRRTMKEWFI